MSSKYAKNNWMATMPGIDLLSMNELSLPGTHNAGSDWKASYPFFGPPAHWLACQHQSFLHQLRNGARALDLRLMVDKGATGIEQFRFHHNEYPNSRRLGDLINDVKNFLDENPDEFIFLDFHKTSGPGFDYAYFSRMMIQLLGHRMIPARNAHLNIGQLKRLSDKQRVIAAVSHNNGIDYNMFIDQINHEWSGIPDTNVTELHQHITNVLKNPPSKWRPWSLSATSYSKLGGPVDIHGHLDSWFNPETSDWAYDCNIINVDFFEESKIVEYCQIMNDIKIQHRRWELQPERTGAVAV